VFVLPKMDALSLDLLVGYQHQRNRYNMVDPMVSAHYLISDVWYYNPSLPADIGINCYYKVIYKGPRVGIRLNASSGKVNTRIVLAYSWLESKAHGWWNLRDYAFWHESKDGYGIDTEIEILFTVTDSLSIGFGYSYFFRRVKNLKASGTFYGIPAYNELDIIRNVNNKIYGPSFVIRYCW